MRVYADFKEAQNEIKRDLNELGMDVQTETMQDKQIADDPDYATKELANYLYMVLDPDFTKIDGLHVDWVEQEWLDRLQGTLNPGHAWKLRKDVWEEFLESTRKAEKMPRRFAYTYSERMGGYHITKIIEELKRHPHSRQLYLPVWKWTDEERRGERRVPCSLGYHFMYRAERLHITYSMRSCDFITHYPNDVCLASMLLHHVAEKAGMPVGSLTHFVNSLHVYARDVKGTF